MNFLVETHQFADDGFYLKLLLFIGSIMLVEIKKIIYKSKLTMINEDNANIY